MDKLKTTGLGGFPFVLDDIRQFLGRLTSPANHGIYQAFNNILGGFGTDFIVQGCVVSGSTGAFSITEGWILLSGELIKVDAQGPFNEASDSTFTKVTTFDSRGNKDFLNGSTDDTYEKNRGVISGLAGTLEFNGNRVAELNIVETIDASSVVSTAVIKEKIIEIGDWNMDTTGTVFVPHLLADITKIRSVAVVIIDDASGSVTELGFAQSGGLIDQGVGVGSSDVLLTRESGGIFDSTAYDSTSFNRGSITIRYEA